MKTGNLTEWALFRNVAGEGSVAGVADHWKNIKRSKNRRFGLDIAAVKNYSIARFVQHPPQLTPRDRAANGEIIFLIMENDEMIKHTSGKTQFFSRSQIEKAGRIVKNIYASEQEKKAALEIIENWRTAHAFPLHIIYDQLLKLANGHNNVVVAERLKSLCSIKDKIKRGDAKNLWTMQDIGGCRFIVPTVNDVYTFADNYDASTNTHIPVREDDYIRNPKASGYRSLHRIYTFQSDKKEPHIRNMTIEIQFRTHLQHIWAAAVETMKVFTGYNVKSGDGPAEIKRFFALVSSLFAIQEKQRIVPETQNNIDDLIEEIKEIDLKEHYLHFLDRMKNATTTTVENNVFEGQYNYYILSLNHKTRSLFVIPSNNFDNANKLYKMYEKKYSSPDINTVLVQVPSISMLYEAYRNYYTDISQWN